MAIHYKNPATGEYEVIKIPVMKGEQGHSGIHVGTDAPPTTDVKLWFDPSDTDNDVDLANRLDTTLTACVDYMGNDRGSIKKAADANVDWLLGEVNTAHYEGQHITATDSIEGQSKSAILRGNTLVNILNGNVSINENVPYHDYKTDIEFKANTVYTAIFKVESEATSITCGLLEDGGTWNGRLADVRSGYNKVLLTPTTTKSYGLRIRHFDGASVAINTSDVMLIEGDYTNQEIPYFTGMQSVKVPVLTTTGKNLVHIQPKDGIGYSKNGITVSFNSDKQTILVNGTCNADNTVFYFKDVHIELEEGDVVRGFAECLQGVGGEISFRTNADGWTASLTTIINRGSITGSGIYTAKGSYIMNGHGIRIDSGESFDNAEYRWIVVKNETNTSYEHYKSNTLSCNEEVTLRGIGDVKDELNLLTGEVVERIGEIVLDGSENWNFSSPLSDTTAMFSLNYIINTLSRYPKSFITDSSYPNRDVYGSERDYEGIELSTSNPRTIFIKVKKSSLDGWDESLSSVQKADLFKSLLTKKPITMQYQLATESIKTVDLSDNVVYSYKDTTHYTCSSEDGSLIPTLSIDVPTNLPALVSKQRELIVALEQENQSLVDELEQAIITSEFNDNELLAQSFEMDFRLMEIEFALGLPMASTFQLGGNKMAMTPYAMAKN